MPCECTVSFNYTLTGSTLMASVTLNNNRADHTQFVAFLYIAARVTLTPPRRRYSINNQEIPAVYVNAFLDNLVAYTGDSQLPRPAPHAPACENLPTAIACFSKKM